MIVWNLSRSHVQLQNLHEDNQRLQAPKQRQDKRSIIQRTKELLNWQNPRPRHVVRSGFCFVIGFASSEVFAIAKGEWIILTSPSSTGEDDLPYRIARREAHRADNALVLSWRDMQFEPRNSQRFKEQAFTFTYLNHALLAYISAFNRDRDHQKELDPELIHFANDLIEALQKTSLSINVGKTSKNFRIIDLLQQIRYRIRGSSQPIPRQQFTSLHNIAEATG